MNALLGTDLLPTRSTTATAVVTKIKKGKVDTASIREGTHRQNVSVERAKDTILNYKIGKNGEAAEDTFTMPIEWLSDEVELRDTPGLGDSAQDGRLEKITLDALESTDLCVMVFDSASVFSAAERHLIKLVNKKLNGNVVYAVNRTNLLSGLDQLNEIDSLCRKTFSELKYSSPELGRYYLMCSSPGITDLDGFDSWFNNICSGTKSAAQKRNELRRLAKTGKLEEYKEKMTERMEECYNKLEKQLDEVSTLHESELKRLQRIEQNKYNERVNRLNSVSQEAQSYLFNTDLLRSRLEALKTKSDWTSFYSSRSKEAANQLFLDNFDLIVDMYPDVFKSFDSAFIKNTTENMAFPSRHTKTIKSDTGGKVAGAGLGALIGSLFGPVGVAVGAGIGSALAGGDSSIDDSVDNTIRYVNSNVIDRLRSDFSYLISKKRNSI